MFMFSRKRIWVGGILISAATLIFAGFTFLGKVSQQSSAFALLLVAYVVFGVSFALRPSRPNRTDLEEKIKTLGNTFEQANRVAAQLQELSTQFHEEINARQSHLDKLETQSEVAKKIIEDLTEEEYAAISAAIRTQMSRVETKQWLISFLLGVATNILTYFFLEGR